MVAMWLFQRMSSQGLHNKVFRSDRSSYWQFTQRCFRNFSVNMELFPNKKKIVTKKLTNNRRVWKQQVCVCVLAVKGWNALDIYFFCLPQHSFLLLSETFRFCCGELPLSTLGPCVTNMGMSPGQPAYFIRLATVIAVGKGSSQPNIGQHQEFFF